MAEGTSAIHAGAPVTGTGGVLSAPVGTMRPETASDALDELFVPRGYVGDAGVTKTVNANDEKIRAWGGDVVKVVRQDHSISYSWTFLESSNAGTLKAMFGEDNVVVAAPTVEHGGQITIMNKSDMVPREAFVLDMKDGDARIREFIPDGQLTVSGDVNFVHSNVIAYTVTLEAFPDEDGVKAYSMIDDGVKTEG